jgi:hypothetical protein
MKQPSGIPFRWVLPVAQIILCAILLWPFRPGYMIQIRSALHGYWPELVDRQELSIRLNEPNRGNGSGAQPNTEWRLVAPQLLNMPVGLTGLAMRATVPMGMMAEWWRSITWPIVGIFFWWIVGRGLEAILASRRLQISPRLHWAETIVALLVSFGMGAILVGLAADASWRSESILPWQPEIAACFLWLILGLAIAVAHLLQMRLKVGFVSEPGAPSVRP